MNHHEEHEGREFDALSRQVIGCAIEVHRFLGPGLLESSYQRCLSRELELNGIALSGIQTGLMFNFNVTKLKDGMKRYVL